jgi:hypothetical protein
MGKGFSGPAIINHLLAYGTKAVGTVMPNREELPKQAFAAKLKKGKINCTTQKSLHSYKWRDVSEVYTLSTAHGDQMSEVQSSRPSTTRKSSLF